MPDRGKVIQHFQDAIEASGNNNKWRFVRLDIVEDAIALLKEQEPRVLALDEVEKIDGQIYLEYYVNGKAMWAFVWHNKSSTLSFILDGSCEEYIDVFAKSSYGSMWRCWSAKPTDEKRKEAKWE